MMQDFRADLHCHTTCSDGTMTPEEVVALAAEKGLQGLSITDHDTVEAYNTAVAAAKEHGIKLLSGVEFSCNHHGTSVHVLAYAFPLGSALIHDFSERHRERRHQRCLAILERLADYDIHITEEELGQHTMVGRPHIAQAMVDRGIVSDIQAAFHKFLGDGKCAFVPSLSLSVEETINLIHKARGLAFIAHPILIKKGRVLNALLKMNFDGLEGYYARFRRTEEAPYIEMAKKNNLIISGGSDFHGAIKPRISLGCSWAPQETFDLLYRHFEEVSSGGHIL